MSLNEQLAELCGKQVYTSQQDGLLYEKHPLIDFEDLCETWNPTTDLNQLRMCYEVAEKDWDRHDDGTFQGEFECNLRFLLEYRFVGETESEYQRLVATAWVKHPELVAQAILKAKGVS